MTSFQDFLKNGRFQGYAYAYPHKSAYRPIEARSLGDTWANEQTDALFLYMHVPFCEMRCGFCNLFTVAKPDHDEGERYLDVLERQALMTREALPDARFARLAIGGGTPTQLAPDALSRLFDIAEHSMGAALHDIPLSCEMSPETATEEKLDILASRGVTRASIGIQSFVTEETRAVRRPQDPTVVERALEAIAARSFPSFNIDLIYGMPGQTPKTWLESIERALSFGPDELFLYPLYVRPLTGLGNSPKAWDDHRFELYVSGRDYLLERGWHQVSMRMFRRGSHQASGAPVYRCQEDGMVGLGAGARSYTRELHYSTEYAVGRRGVQAILHDFMGRDDQSLSTIDYGVQINDVEKRHRYTILSLLSDEGLDVERYSHVFGGAPDEDFPQLRELVSSGYADYSGGVLRLSVSGMSLSDAIGPWLYSATVNGLSAEFELS